MKNINKTAHGASLLPSGKATHLLRRKVIEIIHRANRKVKANGLNKLPRIGVRIVTNGDGTFAGYGKIDQCIIHIAESTLKYTELNLLHVVLHEVLHGLGYPHKQKCKLMHPNWDNGPIVESEQWAVFNEYVADYQSNC